MNPGNGIETIELAKRGFANTKPFLFMNPGNGIETVLMRCQHSTAPIFFLIYESWKRD